MTQPARRAARPIGRTSSAACTPPEATTGRPVASRISRMAAKFGPDSMPSVAISV